MTRLVRALLVGTLCLLSVHPLAAQSVTPPQRPLRQQTAPAQRAQLDRQLSRRIGAVVRNRLKLTDSTYRRLVATNQKYESQRQQLVQQERATRLGLRAEIMAGDQADQQHLATLLTRLMALEQQRLDLTTREQQDLSEFLTPLQRAQYLGIEEQVRRRVQQLRRKRQRTGGRGAGGAQGPGRDR
ncbi:MAG TPA: hypothetical protein VFW98_07120 [Gemmatimonadaceae bacterium]|nr:hypothetical protein [Gemmatimonadaceae bacterium]